ncbi:sodium/hydrogen exchanger 2-like [Symsagittifera roscoffensis]|uniref:sodium/hydrogen exchanger 2-like n=1 Tax=Symsagittifera roscoffensis TaxID=84072 RepID=UPI00307C1A3C
MIFSVFCLEDIRLSGRESVAESDYEVHVILCRWSLSVILAIISGLLCGHLSYLYTNLYKMTYHNVPIVEPLMVFCLFYFSYIVAQMFGFGGPLAATTCALYMSVYTEPRKEVSVFWELKTCNLKNI